MLELSDVDFSDLTDGDVASLLLQRTGYMRKSPDGRPAAFLAWMQGNDQPLASEARERRDEVLALYQREMQAEFDALYPHLPAGVRSVADIGAGLGLLDLAFGRAYGAALHLVDIETTSHRYHLYAERAAGYSRLEGARRMLVRNGIGPGDIVVTNPTRTNLEPIGYDVVVSLLAMGFHFPCETYRGFVERGLRSGGVCVFDHRNGTDQSEFLALFESVETVATYPKFRRLVCRRS